MKNSKFEKFEGKKLKKKSSVNLKGGGKKKALTYDWTYSPSFEGDEELN